jgi:hypothetical protein
MRQSVLPALVCLTAALTLAGISRPQPPRRAAQAGGKVPALPAPVVPGVRRAVEAEVARHLADEQAAVLKEMRRRAELYPALFKTPLCLKGLGDPWGAMTDLERHGLDIAAAAREGLAGLPRLLDRLSAALGKPAAEVAEVPRGKLVSLDDHVRYLTAVLDRARAQRDEALAKLSPADRQFLFSWPTQLIPTFGPQAGLDDRTRTVLKNDRALCAFVQDSYDWPKFVGAARTLAALADPGYLASLKQALESARPIDEKVPGVTGELLYKKETRHGLILFGGKGPNTYDLKVPVALLVDLGGDDHYKGLIASGFDADHPHSVVIDLAGNDTYEAGELGLATGRAGGVGLLIDLAGNDTYKLPPGAGGTGFGGIGILCDVAGDDYYAGSRLTQGAAVGGLGLLLDLAGDDRYTSWGLALGFGGPVGVGAVIDVAGRDSYQCGKHYPSGYNASDAPGAKPDDPRFQYDCFGLGMGMGRRVVPPTDEGNAFSLAGGVGMVIDLAGNDRSDSSNFSQACGYFFGTGLKLDLAGDDEHGAARYGHAAGAHYGLGLFIDYAGKDTYTSTGPTYNCGCAWDHSAFLFIDAGAQGDTYRLDRSGGLGMADIGSWAVFADLGGRDRYRAGGGPAAATQKALAVFYDAGGEDDYAGVKGSASRPANGQTRQGPLTWLFVDRP